jgi:hypothetical protein
VRICKRWLCWGRHAGNTRGKMAWVGARWTPELLLQSLVLLGRGVQCSRQAMMDAR